MLCEGVCVCVCVVCVQFKVCVFTCMHVCGVSLCV